jgi:hypothetical protein
MGVRCNRPNAMMWGLESNASDTLVSDDCSGERERIF